MGNANPRYLRAWPAEQLVTGGGAALVYGTPAELLAGVDPLKVYSAAALASASVAGITAGAGDAGKFLRLDGVGKIAPDVVATATATEIQAGAATGVTDAATLAIASVKSFGSMADDGKYVRVTNSGKVDLTLLPIATALVYRGTAQPVSTAPAGPVVGDVYILNAGGTFDPTWGALSGTPAATGDQLIYDGTNWNLIGATSGGTVNSVGAGNGLLGGPITTAGVLSINYGTATDLMSGTDTVKLYNAATLAAASTVASAGAADAGKFIKLDPTGKINASMLPPAGGTGTVTNITTGVGLSGGPITTTGTISLATSGVAAGTYTKVTVDAYGRVTGAINPNTLAGYGITDAVPNTASVSGGTSLTGGGALSGAPLTITLVNDAAAPGAAKYYGTDGAGVKGWQTFPAAGGTGTVTNVATGAGLTGGPINTTGTISLAASGVTAGTSGSATTIPVVTVDTYGRITGITTQTVTPAWTDVTGKPTTVAASGLTDAVANTRAITGATSLTGGGDLSADRTISLVNDSAAPGNSFYYGTDGAGTKGWHAFPAAGGTGTVTSVATGVGLTGGPITSSGTISLAASGVAAGTYNAVTVDAYGRVTAGTNPTTLSGHGITDAVANSRQITGTTSLTGGGDLTADRTISLLNDSAAPGNDFFYGTTSAGVKGWRDLSGLGYVVGPATATDNAIARYDLTTGKLIQNSVAILDDSGNLSGVNDLTTTGNTILGDAAADTYTFNGSTMAVPNNLNVASNTLMIDSANSRVGFGTASPLATVDISGLLAEVPIAVAGPAAVLDVSLGRHFTTTVTAATTFSFLNTPAGRAVTVLLSVVDGGSQSLTWPTVQWVDGSPPALKATGTDLIVFYTLDGGTTWIADSLTKSSSSLVKTYTAAEATTTGFPVGEGVEVTYMATTSGLFTTGGDSQTRVRFSTNGGTTWGGGSGIGTLSSYGGATGSVTTATRYLIRTRVARIDATSFLVFHEAVSNLTYRVGTGTVGAITNGRIDLGGYTTTTIIGKVTVTSL